MPFDAPALRLKLSLLDRRIYLRLRSQPRLAIEAGNHLMAEWLRLDDE